MLLSEIGRGQRKSVMKFISDDPSMIVLGSRYLHDDGAVQYYLGSELYCDCLGQKFKCSICTGVYLIVISIIVVYLSLLLSIKVIVDKL